MSDLCVHGHGDYCEACAIATERRLRSEIVEVRATLRAAKAEVERLTRERDEAFARVARTGELISRSRAAAEAEVARLTRERDEAMQDYLRAKEAQHMAEQSRATEEARTDRAEAEAERLRAALRDACIGHADDCGCDGCALAFARAALGDK